MIERDGELLSETDLADLRMAKLKLVSPSFTARVSDLVGKPIEAGFKLLPRQVSDKVGEVMRIALLKGLDIAVRSLGRGNSRTSRDWLHKVLVTGSGTAGQLSVGTYIDFNVKFLLVFGCAFELPLALTLLAVAGVLTAKQLAQYRKHATWRP